MRYAQIRNMDISNGEGIGVALFVQGCHFHCKDCFNQETWDFNGGKEWGDKTEDEFVELIKRPYIKRVSILGGEPLADENLDDVLHLVQRIKNEFYNTTIYSDTECENHNILNENLQQIRVLFTNTKIIWLYSGYTFEQCLADKKRNNILKHIDVMIDGRFENDKKDLSLKFRGSSNQRVIDVQKSLETGEIVGLCTD